MSLTLNGYTVPTPQDRLLQVEQAFIDAFGSNFNTDPSTPQGLLIQNIANGYSDADAEYLNLAYSINPDVATNQALDAIANFSYINRTPATYTQVTCQVTGQAGVIILKGSIVLDMAGNQFYSVSDITIGLLGTGSGLFQCTQTGTVITPPNTVNRIFQNLTGWDTINNDGTGSNFTGAPIEPDYIFRARRRIAIFRGVQLVEAMNATINQIPDNSINHDHPIIAGLVIGNNKSAPDTSGTLTIPVGYIAIVIYGGNDDDIAEFIYKYVTGCGTVLGGTASRTVNFTPPSNYGTYPTYVYNLFTPIVEQLYITINAYIPAGASATLADSIKSAIYTDYTTNKADYPLIGQKLQALQFARYCFAFGVNIAPSTIFIGTSPSPTGDSIEVTKDTILLLTLPTTHIIINFTLL